MNDYDFELDFGGQVEIDAVLPAYHGLDGATFVPSVSEQGVLSWENNKGLPNPESVDLVTSVINALPSAVGVEF